MEYEVKWNYRSSLGGPWTKGQIIQVADALAEAINRDSPGVLKPVTKAEPKPKAEAKPKAEPKPKPVKGTNRMQTEGQERLVE